MGNRARCDVRAWLKHGGVTSTVVTFAQVAGSCDAVTGVTAPMFQLSAPLVSQAVVETSES